MSPCDDDLGFRAKIVLAALEWRGTPYRHQASARGTGADCLGLVRGVWRDVLGDEPSAIPPYTASWGSDDRSLEQAADQFLVRQPSGEPEAGEVLLFKMAAQKPPRHCGIFLGSGRFLHAYDGRAVVASWLSRFWRNRLAARYAFPSRPARGTA